MKIKVLGMDPSLRNWGLATGLLDLEAGTLTDLELDVIQPKETTSKQVRQNSKDLEIARILAEEIKPRVYGARAIFVEVPVGSQNARAMVSYGVVAGVLGTFAAHGIEFIEVTPTEVKKVFTGKKDASKELMISTAHRLYPHANWPMHKGQIAGKAEHMADAIAAIHAGVRTPVFRNLMQFLKASK